MGIATSLLALSDSIDPSQAYWSVLLTTGKRYSEHQLLPTFRKGQRGVRTLDWALDLVSTGDIHKIKELTLHCPDGQNAVLELTEPGEQRSLWPAFQFKTKALDMLGAGGSRMEYQVIGRVIEKASGRCECFIWDYYPEPGQPHLLAYKSSIYSFGSWRKTVTPIGALAHDVQGFRLS